MSIQAIAHRIELPVVTTFEPADYVELRWKNMPELIASGEEEAGLDRAAIQAQYDIMCGSSYVGDSDDRLIVVDREVVGGVGFSSFAKGFTGRHAALYYWLDKDAQGNGYATAAARELAKWGLTSCGLTMVKIAVRHDNKPSQGVVRRLNAEVINGDAEKRVWGIRA